MVLEDPLTPILHAFKMLAAAKELAVASEERDTLKEFTLEAASKGRHPLLVSTLIVNLPYLSIINT